jgi:hypothetical protein
MLEIIKNKKNRQFFLEIAADAVSQAEQNLSDPKERTRWVNAIAKGVKLLEERGDFITWMPDDKSIVIWSESDKIYAANGVCQCEAYTKGIKRRNKPFPCKHRALARMIRLYFELQEKPIRQDESSAADSQAQPVLSNVASAAPQSDIHSFNNAPYLKPSSDKKPEKIGNVRI